MMSVSKLEKVLCFLTGYRIVCKKGTFGAKYDISILDVPEDDLYDTCAQVYMYEREVFGDYRGRFAAMAYTPDETSWYFPESSADFVSFMQTPCKQCKKATGTVDIVQTTCESQIELEEFSLAA